MSQRIDSWFGVVLRVVGVAYGCLTGVALMRATHLGTWWVLLMAAAASLAGYRAGVRLHRKSVEQKWIDSDGDRWRVLAVAAALFMFYLGSYMLVVLLLHSKGAAEVL